MNRIKGKQENQLGKINLSSESLDPVYLCFCDILGFKEIFKSGNLDQFTNAYQAFISDELFNLTLALEGYVSGETVRTYLSYLMVSDSIVIYSADNSYHNFIRIVGAVKFFMKYFFHQGFPLRSAITHGKISRIEGNIEGNQKFDCRVILGNPLVEAFQLEKECNWSGCLVDDKTIDHIRSMRDYNGLELIDHNYIVKYDLPKKTGKKSGYAVNWTDSNSHLISEDVILMKFGANGKKIEKDEVKEKMKNTNEFVRFIELLGPDRLGLK